MSDLPRFLFDECIGKPVMQELHRTLMPDASFVHIIDHFHEGGKDPVWVPQLAADGDWVVITSDGGKNSKRSDKLPDICREYSVTHLVLSKTLHDLGSPLKVTALVGCWAEIMPLHREPRGTRWNLKYKTIKKGGLVLWVEKLPITPPAPSKVDPAAAPEDQSLPSSLPLQETDQRLPGPSS